MGYESDALAELRELLDPSSDTKLPAGLTIIGLDHTVINVHPGHVTVSVEHGPHKSIEILPRGRRTQPSGGAKPKAGDKTP